MMEFPREKKLFKKDKVQRGWDIQRGKNQVILLFKDLFIYLYFNYLYVCGLFGMKYVNVSEESLEARRGHRSL